MTYSLLDIAVVVRDLARHPAGDRLAADLLHALAVDDAALADLDAMPEPADATALRDRLLAAATSQPRALELLGTVREAARTGGLAAWTESLDALEAAPIGGPLALSRWVCDELLAAAWDRHGEVAVARRPRALHAVGDAVLVSWLPTPPDDPASRLADRWRSWTAAHPLPAPVGGDGTPAGSVLTALRTATPDGLAAAGAAMRAARAGGWSWAIAMHDACWALELTGRLRVAATAQLHALRATLAVTGSPLLRADVVAAVTAAVHASAAADLLAADTVAAMCGPLLANV